MERRELLINLAFLAVALPIVFFIFQGYATMYFKNKAIDLSNPLNLQVTKVFVTENSISFLLYNPNNFSVTITVNMVGLRNSFGSVAPVTQGGDIGVTKVLPPRQNVTFYIPIIKGTPPNTVLIQWRNAGGNLTIAIYYNTPNSNVNGVVMTKISK